jgi:putative acetyltransferase
MFIRRELPEDIDPIRVVTASAFDGRPYSNGTEARLVDELRADTGWLPALSLVAVVDGRVVGHLCCTRATVADTPALGLGPVSVEPSRQRTGVGSALVHAVLGAADALDEPVVVLLGDPGYYHRFGFVLAGQYGITPPDLQWAEHFQARALTSYRPDITGPFTYAEPFTRV